VYQYHSHVWPLPYGQPGLVRVTFQEWSLERKRRPVEKLMAMEQFSALAYDKMGPVLVNEQQPAELKFRSPQGKGVTAGRMLRPPLQKAQGGATSSCNGHLESVASSL
jgi:hypothetical protein